MSGEHLGYAFVRISNVTECRPRPEDLQIRPCRAGSDARITGLDVDVLNLTPLVGQLKPPNAVPPKTQPRCITNFT